MSPRNLNAPRTNRLPSWPNACRAFLHHQLDFLRISRANKLYFDPGANLGFADERLRVDVRRGGGSYEMQIVRARAGSPIALQLSPAFPRGTRIRGVKVNDEDVATHIESNAHDLHVLIEASLRHEVNVEIEYDSPARRASVR